ncbi:MAG: hypothetical protein O6952_02115 [Planctomycetota bacterium]|nr:hypothetical protein [Planctomycetota bacterium]
MPLFFLAGGILVIPGGWVSQARLTARIPLPWRRPTAPLEPAADRIRSLLEENARLKADVRRLGAMLSEISGFDQFAPDFPSDRILPAIVLVRGDSDPLRESITLRVGSDDGVRTGDPVLLGLSLVGLIQEVSPTRSSVRLVTDPASRIRAFCPQSESEVSIEGRGADRLSISLKEALVPYRAGAEMLTVEEDKIPPRLLLGTLVSESSGEVSPLWSASELAIVKVLLGGEDAGE